VGVTVGRQRRTGRGPDFRRLLATVGAANLADGLYIAAGPLLAARLTADPLPVAGVVVAQRASVVVAVLGAGVLVDRLDRSRLLVFGNLLRATVFGLLAGAVLLGVGGPAGLALVYAAAVVLGLAEALVDTAAVALVPDVVEQERLDTANGRVEAAASAGNELVGPPAGGLLFAVAAWAPFVGSAAAFALAGTAAHRLSGRVPAGAPAPAAGRSAWREAREGWSWFWRHPLLRVAAVGAFAANLLATGALSVLVLLVTRRLGYSEGWFGVILLGLAVGSLAAGWTVGPISARTGPGPVILAGHLGVAAGFALIVTTGSAVGVAAGLATVSFAATASNVIVHTVRQTVVPRHLLGRLTASYRVVALLGMPVGAVVAGLLARVDLRAPYVVAAAGFVVLAAVLGRILRTSRIEAARAAVAPATRADDAAPSAERAIPFARPLA
jgi:MFS family permease